LILESKINEILNDIPIDTYTILAGDWNNVFNPTLDRSHSVNTYTSTRPEHRLLTRLTSTHRRIPLIDIYRLIYPHTKAFSHILTLPTAIIRSRIDFFLTSQNVIGRISLCDIETSELIDPILHHNIISLDIKLPDNQINLRYNNFIPITTNYLFNRASMDAVTDSANTPYLTYHSASLSNSIQSNIPITPLNLSTLYRTFTTKLKQAAKQHIPSRTHYPNSDTKHYNLIQQPNAKAKKAQLTISKQMRFLLTVRHKFKENKPITSAILLRFHRLAREYNLNIQANLDTLIRQLPNKLEKTIRQINNASLKYNIQNRTRNFSNQTKNHIKNIMNKHVQSSSSIPSI
jgi:hypothetical protein